MPCHDCLIWVGQSYKTVQDFVDEASKRGCCRQIPGWPAWIRPGETRVFLAHRDRQAKLSGRGVVFGYFLLRGVDVVMLPEDCDTYKRHTEQVRTLGRRGTSWRVWQASEGKHCAGQMIDFWRNKPLNGKLPFRTPPPGWEDDPEDSYEEVWDFISDFLISCEPEGGRPSHGGYGISTDQTALEQSRGCGLRLGPTFPEKAGRPALYLVDALAREVDEEFCEFLKEILKEMLKDRSRHGTKTRHAQRSIMRILRSKAAAEKPGGGQQGLPEFEDAVHSAGDSVSRPRPSTSLAGNATGEGTLIVFRRPFPVFENYPQASFRGLLRLDGGHLLRRIARWYSGKRRDHNIELPLCAGEDTSQGKARKQSEFLTWMGRELHWNRTLVHRFLEGLGSASAAELVKKRPVELPGTGQLYRKNSSSSGVMFTPSSRLRKELTLAGKADKTGTTDQARALPGLVARRLKLPKVKGKTKLTSRAFASLARWIERQLAEGRPARLTKLGTFTVKRKSGHVEFRTSQHLRGQLP